MHIHRYADAESTLGGGLAEWAEEAFITLGKQVLGGGGGGGNIGGNIDGMLHIFTTLERF